VDLDALLVLGDLLAGEPLDVARLAELVEEELQRGDVAQLEVFVGGARRARPAAPAIPPR
jgi:hypothetical protein